MVVRLDSEEASPKEEPLSPAHDLRFARHVSSVDVNSVHGSGVPSGFDIEPVSHDTVMTFKV
jgi:hypothetical protein